MTPRPVFSEDERAVIRDRHTGWERASTALLGEIFHTTPQTIAAICRGTPKS